METITLKFKASGQKLTADSCPQNYASNTVNYIQAEFDLDDNWKSFDSVRAVWHNDFACISTVLDGNGACTVPHEVLENLEETQVNLVGSNVDGTELTDRLTTYPIRAAIIDAEALICGTETAEVTPSQFEQYIAIVEQIVGTVKDIDHTELTDDYCLIIYYSDGTDSGKLGPIRGATGATGNGIVSAVLNADYTLTLTYDNGDSDTVGPIRGAQGETGNGIESIYLTETHGAVKTYTILFTDGTTTTFDVTDGEVTRAELEAVLPTDTASGSIASFPDGSNLFDYLSCIVDIDPVQDLHGYDKPWVGGGGKNKFESLNGKANNVTFARQDDGTVLITGTATSTSWTFLQEYYELPYNGIVAGGDISAYTDKYMIVQFYNGSTQVGTSLNPSNGVMYGTVPAEATRIRIIQYPESSQTTEGTVFNTVAHYYVGTETNGAFTSWTPYENICPITGWTGCEVSKTGVNVWDEEWEVSGSRINSKNLIPVLPNMEYAWVSPAQPSNGLRFYDADKNLISTLYTVNNGKFTTPVDCFYIWFALTSGYGPTYNHDISINYPSTDTTYHAYNPNSAGYPVSWQTEAGTVYGGTVDLVTGVLTVKYLITDLGNFSWTYRTSGSQLAPYFWASVTSLGIKYLGTFGVTPHHIICSQYKTTARNTNVFLNGCICADGENDTVSQLQIKDDQYTDGTAFTNAMNGVQLVYELATPQTYQLDTVQVACLLGQNNVWANCGDTSVTYKADVQRWVEKKLGA